MQTENNIENFDEDDDIILPDTLWGEIKLIAFILCRMLKYPDERKKLYIELRRQIAFYFLWMKNK